MMMRQKTRTIPCSVCHSPFAGRGTSIYFRAPVIDGKQPPVNAGEICPVCRDDFLRYALNAAPESAYARSIAARQASRSSR